jgi:death-on-curing protein
LTRYISLAEYFWLAEQVTGIDAVTLEHVSRSELADSALHAPAAGFGDVDTYPSRIEKAAVLVARLAWNHPLPDGNKRAAWATLLMFVDLNGGRWVPDPPDVEAAVSMMFDLAARELSEADVVAWLDERVSFGGAPRASGPSDVER